MAEPFKLLLNAPLVAHAAGHFARVSTGFDAEAFTATATAGLDTLELKARAMQIADALEACLPADFGTAAGVIEAALAPAPDPARLGALQDDPSEVVRRSVANHLNDIARDHPALVAQWLAEHLPGAPAPRRALLRHASRSLIKAGDATALQAWGLGAAFCGRASLQLSADQATVGDTLQLTVLLHSSASAPQRLAIDYAVHHVKAGGHTTPKVFKGWVVELAAGASRQLVKRHSLKAITTRRYHAGAHALDVRINGQVVAEAGFRLAFA